MGAEPVDWRLPCNGVSVRVTPRRRVAQETAQSYLLRVGGWRRLSRATTLPALMHDVHTLTRFLLPPGRATACTVWMFGSHRRLVRRCECDTDLPKPGPFPQISHTAAICKTPRISTWGSGSSGQRPAADRPDNPTRIPARRVITKMVVRGARAKFPGAVSSSDRLAPTSTLEQGVPDIGLEVGCRIGGSTPPLCGTGLTPPSAT